VAGVVALLLQVIPIVYIFCSYIKKIILSKANPQLYWYEIQHILIASAMVIHPEDTKWQTNGANRKYHHQYGFVILSRFFF
jgi:hypothetical protein